MPNFTWTPDQGAKRSTKAAVLKAKFGDGYEQRVGDGINSISESWDLSFSTRTKTEILAISAFLAAQKGVTGFTWVTPRGETLKFQCDTWSESYTNDFNDSLTATFTRWFGP